MYKIYGCFVITLLFLAGCGGSGGGASGAQPTVVRVTLATQGVLPTGDLSGIGVTLQLPAGVTPTLTASGAVDSSVVEANGVLSKDSSLSATVYTPATSTTPGTLVLVLASKPPNGFGLGEFATVTLNIAAGSVNFATVNLDSSAGTTSSVFTGLKVTSYSPVDLAFSDTEVVKNYITVLLTAVTI